MTAVVARQKGTTQDDASKDIVCLLMVPLRRIFELQTEQLVSLYGWFNCWQVASNCLVISTKYAVREVRLFLWL